jgi:hypothetical protein
MRIAAQHWKLAFACTAVLVAAIGCNRSEPRGDVSGEVSYNGKPVETGAISFEPMEAASTPRNLTVQSGVYRSDEKSALKPGKYRVRLSANDPSKKKGNIDLNNPNVRVDFIPLLPPSWNAQSQLTVEVKAGKNTFNFQGNKGQEPRVETVAAQ